MGSTTTIHDLPDDLLSRQILLRLDTPIWLIRAACVSKRWRRAVTCDGDEGRAFLRLASSVHPPTVVGQYHSLTVVGGGHRFVPVPVPSSSSSICSIDSTRFSDFPAVVDEYSSRLLHVADCHGGLVLLCTSSNSDLVVFDPLTRKRRWISGAPTMKKNNYAGRGTGDDDLFLLDGDDDDGGHISMSNFKVLHRGASPQACVFSRRRRGNNHNDAGGGEEEWEWRLLSRRLSDEDLFPRCSLYLAGRVDGSLYLGLKNGSRIIAFDSTGLVFSTVDLPPTCMNTLPSHLLVLPAWSSTFTVVHGAGGGLFDRRSSSPERTRPTTIVHVRGEELELFRRVNGSGEWVLMEHRIANLSEAAARGHGPVCLEKKNGINIAWSAMAAGVNADSAILLARSPATYRHWFFSIDVNTMELRALPEETYRQATRIFNYTLPWPQFLRACP